MNCFEVVSQVSFPHNTVWIDFGSFYFNPLGIRGQKVITSLLIKFLSCVKYLVIINTQSCIKFEWWVNTCPCCSGYDLCGRAKHKNMFVCCSPNLGENLLTCFGVIALFVCYLLYVCYYFQKSSPQKLLYRIQWVLVIMFFRVSELKWNFNFLLKM